MYERFILNKFQNGGAKISAMSAFGLSNDSLEGVKHTENILKKDDLNNPFIDVNQTAKLVRINPIKNNRECLVFFNNDMTIKLLRNLNNDIVQLKKTFITVVQNVSNMYNGTLVVYLEKLKQMSDDKNDVHGYVNVMEQEIQKTKKDIKLLNDDYRNVITMLTKMYNIDKNGVYYKKLDDIKMLQEKDKHVQSRFNAELGKMTFKPTQYEPIYGTHEGTVVEIDNIDLGREYITLKTTGERIRFKNICFELTTPANRQSKPTTEAPKPPTTEAPKPPTTV